MTRRIGIAVPLLLDRDWSIGRLLVCNIDDLVVFEKRRSDIITPTSFTSRPLDCTPITTMGGATWPSCLILGRIIDSLSISLDIYFLSSGQSRGKLVYRFTWIRNSAHKLYTSIFEINAESSLSFSSWNS